MMDKTRLDYLVKEGKLRKRNKDIPRIKSLLDSATKTVNYMRKIPISEDSATVVFREYYESIRQIGDAMLWSIGYEPKGHDVSMEALKEIDIKDKYKLHGLDRFRRMRNNINYRGYKVTIQQAIEISDFWKRYAKEMIRAIESSIR